MSNLSDTWLRPVLPPLRHLHAVALGVRSFMSRAPDVNGDVLVVAPHPDDETFGLCGFMQCVMEKGFRVKVVILTDGSHSHAECCQADDIEVANNRMRLARQVLKEMSIIGADVEFWGICDGALAVSPALISRMSLLIGEFLPSAVFVTDVSDGWSDHVAAFGIVNAALPAEVELYGYGVWSWFYNIWPHRYPEFMAYRLSSSQLRLKRRLVSRYLEAAAPCGESWCGRLPAVLKRAFKSGRELIFKYR